MDTNRYERTVPILEALEIVFEVFEEMAPTLEKERALQICRRLKVVCNSLRMEYELVGIESRAGFH